MFNEKKNRIKELKEVCKSLLVEEVERDGVVLNIFPMTVGEYYKSDIFRQKTILQKVGIGKALKNGGGFLDIETGNVFIFIDKLGKKENIYSVTKLAIVVFAVYHEYGHLLQISKETSSLKRILIDIEMKKNRVMYDDYLKNHDRFFIECDADLYAVSKARDYFKEYFPEGYDEANEYLSNQEMISKFWLNNFDYQMFFDKFYEMCEQKKVKVSDFNNPILNVFYDEFNHFRSIGEIRNSIKEISVDKEILCGILGSCYFLKQLDYSNLLEEEKEFMVQVLDCIILDEDKRFSVNTELYETGGFNSSVYSELCNFALTKLNYLESKYEKLGRKPEKVEFSLEKIKKKI